MKREIYDLLATAIKTHIGALNACNGQARKLFERECSESSKARDRVGLHRAIHKLEVAVHTAALTQIGLTMAVLSALGEAPQDLVDLFDKIAAAPADA